LAFHEKNALFEWCRNLKRGKEGTRGKDKEAGTDNTKEGKHFFLGRTVFRRLKMAWSMVSGADEPGELILGKGGKN